jgi:hypothetical protein
MSITSFQFGPKLRLGPHVPEALLRGTAAQLRKSGLGSHPAERPEGPHRLEMHSASCHAAGAALEAIQQERSCEI